MVVDDRVFCIADGMGGLQLGAEAAETAASAVARLAPELSIDVETESQERRLHPVRQAMTSIAREVYDFSRTSGARLGTTLTLVVFSEGHAIIGHIGDSRAYRIRDGRAELLTEDHTLDRIAGRLGLLKTPLNIRRNVLTQCLGTRANVEPQVAQVDLLPGDRIVLLSDGVWATLGKNTIASIASIIPPEMAAQALVDKALAVGSDDNCTAVVIYVPTVGAAQRNTTSHVMPTLPQSDQRALA